MIVIRSVDRMVALSRQLGEQGKRIGLVPTMGALHDGHRSLIRAARRESDLVIVTIFVNPRQFGPREDFARYPRPLRRDLRLAAQAGADIVFAPSVREMYPPGFETAVEVGPVASRWEGHARPGHFRGVATVVAVLFELTRPSVAYFGQKDYQQLLVVRRLAQDLCLDVTIRMCPIVREPDGLAMSSRNVSLSPSQRRSAGVLWRALTLARERLAAGERAAAPLIREMRRVIRQSPGARIDYVAIVDAKTLEPLRRVRGRVAVLVAAWIGRTRLIDNLLVDVS
jgi:pantoate--beta-alanine ligase